MIFSPRTICGSSSTTRTRGPPAPRGGAHVDAPTASSALAGCGATGKLTVNDRAGVPSGLQDDPSAVGLDEAAADREPEPGAADRRPPVDPGPRPRKNGSNTCERYRRGIPLPRSVTRTVTRPALAPAGDPHRRPGRRELDRVLDQVGEHPLELRRVGAHERQVGRQRELDRVVAAGVGGRRGDDVVQVAPVGLRRHRAGLDPRQVEQVVDQLGQSRALGLDHLDQLGALGLGDADRERRARGRDRGQRRAQVVRDRVEDRGLGHLGAAGGLGLGRPLGHPLALDGDVDQPADRLGDALDRRAAPTPRRRSDTATRCPRAGAAAP